MTKVTREDLRPRIVAAANAIEDDAVWLARVMRTGGDFDRDEITTVRRHAVELITVCEQFLAIRRPAGQRKRVQYAESA